MTTLERPEIRTTGLLTQSWAIARRNFLHIKRMPEMLMDVTIQPVMFVLLFAYVFGGAIETPGVNYREWLIAGIFGQTIVFGATFTGAGLAEDMQKGIIDRFRSLPMSNSAVLVGRTASDVVYNVLSLVIMALTGLLVGWRIREGALDALAGFALLLVFGYAISWVMAWVGLMVPSVEVINNASFIVIMPLTFISNAFVPTSSFNSVLKPVVEWNPVSAVTQASRDLFGNTGLGPGSDAWSLQHPVAYTLAWVVLIIVVFAPLSVRQYRLTTSK